MEALHRTQLQLGPSASSGEHTKSRMWASIDKARELIDYQPVVGLTAGVENNITWFNLYWDEIIKSSDFPPGMSAALPNRST